MTITNFGSGEVEIVDETGRKTRLDREAANRLIMAGRMQTVAEFVEKLPNLISNPEISTAISEAFRKAPTSTGQWNLKEKFARLTTLSKGYQAGHPAEVIEVVSLT